jgi:hypothetical protein
MHCTAAQYQSELPHSNGEDPASRRAGLALCGMDRKQKEATSSYERLWYMHNDLR